MTYDARTRSDQEQPADFDGTVGFLATAPNIDLGADEMGELIMAGYIDSTRIFSHNVTNAGLISDHTRAFFLNIAAPPPVTYPRPVHNLLMGGISGSSIYYLWWPHVQSPVNGSGGTNYTRGNPSPVSSRFLLTATSMFGWENRPTFMRNLECDFSPHLLEDPHPLWTIGWGMFFNQGGYGPIGNEVYATHPWYDALYELGPPAVHWGAWDNPFLFYNPGPPNTQYPQSANAWAPTNYHNVTVGITSAPGSAYYTTDAPPYHPAPPSYFLNGLPLQFFGPFGTCTPSLPNRYSVNALGVGDAGLGCPDEFAYYTSFQGIGLRYNCQATFMNALTNLQSFLVVTQGPTPAELRARGGRPRQEGDSQRLVETTSLRRAAEIRFGR